LTARHCVSDVLNTVQGGVVCPETTFGGPHSAASFTVITAPVIELGGEGEFSVQEVVTLPVSSATFCGNDLAILVLDANVPESLTEPIVPRVDTALTAGEQYSAVGYGATDGGGNEAGTRRRRDDLYVDCVAGECAMVDVMMTTTEWVGDTGICVGDSGGPALDAQGRVVGVTSRGASDCDEPIYGYVYAWAQWLKDTVVYASGMGLYEAPAWTAGANTEPEYSMPIGQSCQIDGDCPAKQCLTEGQKSYCTRPCKQDAPCPDGYSCDSQLNLCREVQATPLPPQSYVRPDRSEGCQLAPLATGQKPWWFTALAALGAWRIMMKRRERRAPNEPTREPLDAGPTIAMYKKLPLGGWVTGGDRPAVRYEVGDH